MGQVPVENSKPLANQILLIGNGRLANSLARVQAGSQIGSRVDSHWYRSLGPTLEQHLKAFHPTHVWLAIPDSALKTFVQENANLFLKDSTVLVHFAGSLPTFSVGGLTVHAVHPLMTFSSSITIAESLSAESVDFRSAPLILDREGPALHTLMPGFDNVAYRIDPNDRPYYHALCAIAGNFSVLLWEAVRSRFESELEIPTAALNLYRDQIFKNLTASAQSDTRTSVLTGPLSRGDTKTLTAHRQALLERAEIPLLKIYDSFADLYRTDRERLRMKKDLE